MTEIKTERPLLRLALENPIPSLLAVSFVAMCAVLGIEELEAGPHAIRWLSRHHASVAVIKQALCMAAIPGFVFLMYWNFRDNMRRSKEPMPRLKAIVIGTLLGGAVLYGVLWYFLFRR